MAKYATAEDLIQCPECETEFDPVHGYLKQYADHFCRCPRCRVRLTVTVTRDYVRVNSPIPFELDDDDREYFDAQRRREIVADRLLEF